MDTHIHTHTHTHCSRSKNKRCKTHTQNNHTNADTHNRIETPQIHIEINVCSVYIALADSLPPPPNSHSSRQPHRIDCLRKGNDVQPVSGFLHPPPPTHPMLLTNSRQDEAAVRGEPELVDESDLEQCGAMWGNAAVIACC